MSPNPDTLTLRTLQQENTRLKDENRVLHKELRRLQQAFRSLNHIQQSLNEITPEVNIFSLLAGLLGAALKAVDAQDGSLQLLDEPNGELVFVEVQGDSREKLTGYRMATSEGIAGWVVTHRQPELVADVRQESRFSPLVDRYTGFRTASLICVPLLYADRVMGAIEVVNPTGTPPFTPEDMDILMVVARLTALALARAEGRNPLVE